MRAIDAQLAAAVCRTVADEMLTAAAQDADLTPAERRHLIAVAEAVSALVEPRLPPECLDETAGKPTRPPPG